LEAAEKLDQDADEHVGIRVALEGLKVDERTWTAIEVVLRNRLAEQARLPGSPSTEDQVRSLTEGYSESPARWLNEPLNGFLGRPNCFGERVLQRLNLIRVQVDLSEHQVAKSMSRTYRSALARPPQPTRHAYV
jgi:hypothetical protein